MGFCQQPAHTVPSEELEKGTLFLWVDAASGQNLSLAKWSVAWVSVAACPRGRPPLDAEQSEQLYKWALCLRPLHRTVPVARGPWLMSSPFPMYVFQAPSLILQFFLLRRGSSLLILLRMGLLKNDRLSEADRKGGGGGGTSRNSQLIPMSFDVS